MRHGRLSLLAALACVSSMVGAPASARSPVEKRRVEIGAWRLDILRDSFSGSVMCRLRARNGKAYYGGSAVGFKFKQRWDVGDAVYRIDGGAPRSSRDDRAELIALGTPTETGGMMNPTNGFVWIPFARLAGANSVAIAPRPGKRPQTFHYHGLKGLLAIGEARGCSPGGRFTR